MMTELIVALDLPDLDEALRLVDVLGERVTWYKTGYEAFYMHGDRLLAELAGRKKRIFLDLKLEDIPNSVAAGVRALGARASLLTVHVAGGRRMLEAAAAARDEVNAAGAHLRLLAVTLLTSVNHDDLRDVGIGEPLHQLVSVRAALAQNCGMDGVVCAVDDAAVVRSRVSDDFLIVCPGVRPAGSSIDDQQRVATPTDAYLAGATAIVVGRPITKAADPRAAAQAVLDEMAAAAALVMPSAER